jgi:hypothetical protein
VDHAERLFYIIALNFFNGKIVNSSSRQAEEEFTLFLVLASVV